MARTIGSPDLVTVAVSAAAAATDSSYIAWRLLGPGE